jgi:hypothetical protein
MFGLLNLKKNSYHTGATATGAIDAPYSRYEGMAPGTPPASKYSRYHKPVAVTALRAAMPQVVEEVPEPTPVQRPMMDPDADLHSDAPISPALLRRALPKRFAGMERHAIRSRAILADRPADEIEFAFA